ncbi:MAG: pentapeptide repeat-containing protein [Dehalococcoidia bacterium]
MSPFSDGQQYHAQRFSRLAMPDTRFTNVEFIDCTFERCAFIRCVFYRCSFIDCRFKTCDLANAQVLNSRFSDMQFTGSKLIGIDWTHAGDSTVSKLLVSIDCEECVLNYSSFFGMKLNGRSFTRCIAHEVDLRNADLTDSNLAGTDFAGALFHESNLSRADLTGATTYDIDPRANVVTKARFSLPEAISLLRGFDVVIE